MMNNSTTHIILAKEVFDVFRVALLNGHNGVKMILICGAASLS